MNNLTAPGAPLWSSAFRPFFLAGAIYGPFVMACWFLFYAGFVEFPWRGFANPLWHGHEMLCGFGSALVAGFLLTAIPGWAETTAITGRRLMLLASVWLLGRIGILLAPMLPVELVAITDLAFFPLFALLLIPSLLNARNRLYFAVLPILAGFFYGNLCFYTGLIEGAPDSQLFGLRFFLYTLIMLYTIVGGFLTPIFTENALREKGWQGRISFHRGIEVMAITSILLYLATSIYLPASSWSLAAGALVFTVHAARMARWQGMRTLRFPLVWVMHVSYLWFLTSVAIRMLSDTGFPALEFVSIHAFTVGAFGMMKIGFFCRVALKHTGRPLQPATLMVIGFGLMFLAALARVAGFLLNINVLVLSSVPLWIAPFLLFLWFHGAMLVRPSLQKG